MQWTYVTPSELLFSPLLIMGNLKQPYTAWTGSSDVCSGLTCAKVWQPAVRYGQADISVAKGIWSNTESPTLP